MVAKDTPATRCASAAQLHYRQRPISEKVDVAEQPQHLTLTQRMDFMRQGNGGAVHIDRRPNVRFGSEADIALGRRHVRFTPKSGHHRATVGCPLSEKNGHSAPHNRRYGDRSIGGLRSLLYARRARD